MTGHDPNETSAFLAGLSHDLRTPLNSLLILAELLAENTDGNLTEKQIEFARTILTSGNQLLELADTVRDRALDGRARERAADVPALVRSSGFDDDREGLTPGDGVVLIVEDDASFASLLLETARSSGLKGVVAGRGDTGLALAHACRPDAIVLDLGLPVLDGPDLIERLRVHPATRDIPIHVITGASGVTPDRDSLASVLEKPVALEDLTVLFDGIVADAADRRARDEGDHEGGIAPESDAAGVLIVDDRPENLQALMAVLEPLGCRIVTAGSGREALRRLRTEQFAVVLLDVQMPGMDGLETAASIRRRPQTRSVPIIFLTGVSASPEHVFRGYEAGAVDYIVKPIDPAILRSKVAVFIDLFEKNREIERQARLLREQEQERREREAAEQRHRRSRLLAAASAALDKRLDVKGRTAQLAQTCVSELGDFALVQLVQPDGVVEVAAVAARGGADDSLRRLVGTRSNVSSFASWVFDPPKAQIFEPVTPEMWIGLGLGNEGDTLSSGLDLRGLIVAPLTLGRRAVGVLVIGSCDTTYGEEELEIAKDVARKAAMAVDNSRLFEAEQERSKALQLSLLGRPQVRNPAVAAAMRYLPGSADLEVGGDWYDLVEREDGRILVAVGDVVGHGVQAATAMGKLRSAAGALALVVESVPDLLSRLDQFAEKIEEALFGTVAAVLLEPVTGELRYSLAGHPPPLILHEDGRAEFLEGGNGLPLCIEDRTGIGRPEGRATLPEGSTLILYTDGLIERRDIPIDTGLERLRKAAASRSRLEPELLCDEIVDEFAGGSLDDLVFLCMRREPRATRVFNRRFPAVPKALAQVRRELRAWLAEQGVQPRRADDVVQACGEGCANAVRHAYGDQPGEAILEVKLRPDGTLFTRVRDWGLWRSQAHAESSGKGMEIMRAVSDGVHVHSTPQGTTVLTEFRTRPAGGVREADPVAGGEAVTVAFARRDLEHGPGTSA